MSEPTKKQTFLTGTAWLAMAAAVVKVIGALYKIPLNAIIGEQGFGYFNTAYEIYNVMLTISVAGLPVAMSRMISQANALGHYNQVRRTYATARAIFLVLGILGSSLMVFGCRWLAARLNQPNAWACILCLGPATLLICMMATFRGFFQGQNNMLPTATSQILEAVVKLIVGMVAALLLLKLTNSIPYAAAGAILGVTISCLVSVGYLAICHSKAKSKLPITHEAVTGYGQTAKGLLSIAIPITIGSAGLSILTLMETAVYMGNLKDVLGYSQAEADTMKGIYDMAKTIFNMPVAFVTPITVSIIPAITAYLTKEDHANARATEESAVRIAGLICAPCAVGLAVLARPVTALLGGYTGANLDLATVLMCLRGASIVFYAVIMVTNAMMQAHGHANLPVVNMLLGGVLKLTATFLLTRNPNLGIVGAPIGALLGDFTIMALNLITMRRCIANPPSIPRHLLRSVGAAMLMGVVVFAAYYALTLVTDSRLILCGGPIAVGVAAYAVCAIKFKAITRSDCLLLPKGEKIANFLHL